MSNKYKFDVVVIGAGVIGLAIAERLRGPYKNILILEKEKKFGQHISSRNSEVIHSGIYNPIDSLKSQLCIKGNDLLYEFFKKYDIPHLNCGKLIVASDKNEEKLLYDKINEIRKYFTKAVKHESYDQTLKVLAEAKSITDNFFDNVIVNDKDINIKKNRLELLQMFCKTYDNFIDFSKVEGG